MAIHPHPNIRPEAPEATPTGKEPLDRAMPVLFLGTYLFAFVFLIASGLSLF